MPLVGLEAETFQEERRPAASRRPALGWPFWLLLAVFFAVMTMGVNELWLFGHPGWNGARRGTAGINYVRYGFVETKFAPVENFGPVEKEKFQVYWHHPVMIHALTGLSFTIFGIHEWAARLVPILLSTLSFVLLYVLALRFWGRRGAVATALAFTFLPLQGFYGKMVNHEPLVLALGLTMAWLVVRFHEARRWRHALAAGGLALLGSFSDWPWFLVLFVVGAFEAVRQLARWRRDRDLRFLLLLSLFAIVGFAAVTYYLTQFSGEIGGFKKLFSDRSGGNGEHYGFKTLWERRNWYYELFGPIATTAGAAWLLAFLPRVGARLVRRGHSDSPLAIGPMDALVGGSFVVGLAWLRLFAQAAHIHEYWAFYLVPFLALSNAWLLLVAARVVEHVVRWVRLERAWRPVGAAVLALGLVLTVAFGARGILARQRIPSDVGQEAPEFRFRNAVFGEWFGQQLKPDDKILLQDGLPLEFALGFYLRVDVARVRIGPRFNHRRIRKGYRYLVLDRNRLPGDESVAILENLARRYPIAIFDRFCVFDLRATDNHDEAIRALRIEFRPTGPLWSWFDSMVYPPWEAVYSEADSFQWALNLDLETAAQRLAARLERPSALRAADPYAEGRRLLDWVAWHNAQRLLGRSTAPALAALGNALGPASSVRFDDVADLPWMWFAPYQGDRIGAFPVIRSRVDGEEAGGVMMHMDHVPVYAFGDRPRVPFLAWTGRVWHGLDPRPTAWRPGYLYADLYAFPAEPFPEDVAVFFERERKKTVLDLRAKPGNRRSPLLGTFDFASGRSYDPGAPYAWTNAAGPLCKPRKDGDVAILPATCLEKLRPKLDVSAEATLVGPDTLDVVGLRYLGGHGGRTWYHLLVEVPKDVTRDWDLKIAVASPRPRPPGYFAGAEGRVRSSRWRAGQLAVLTYAAIGDKGPVSVWVQGRSELHEGGRLPVSGANRPRTTVSRSVATFPAEPDPYYAPRGE